MLYEAMSGVLKGIVPRVPLKRRKCLAGRLGLEESEGIFSKDIPFLDTDTLWCANVLSNVKLRHCVSFTSTPSTIKAFRPTSSPSSSTEISCFPEENGT